MGYIKNETIFGLRLALRYLPVTILAGLIFGIVVSLIILGLRPDFTWKA